MTQVVANTTDWPAIWAAARAKLRRDLGGPVFDAWLGKLTLVAFESNEIRFGAPKPFVRNWIANNYTGRLEKALRAEGGNPKSITIVVAEPEAPVIGGGLLKAAPTEQPLATVSVLAQPATADETRHVSSPPALFVRAPDPALSFSVFVTGAGN